MNFEHEEEHPYSAEPILSEESESAFHREARNVMELFLQRGLRMVFQYKGNKLLALMCWAHALGMAELTGCETATDVSVAMFGSKSKRAAVTKTIKHFQDNLGLPPMPGQRTESGRESMKKSREKQLKK